MWLYLIKKGGLPLSFALLIAIGTVLLLLPGVCNADLGVTDAFFTACSSVCLNGLATVHASEFTLFGPDPAGMFRDLVFERDHPAVCREIPLVQQYPDHVQSQ